jgi:hypothetical protein
VFFNADAVFFTKRTLVLFFNDGLIFNGDAGLTEESETDFTQKGGLIVGFWGEFLLADDQSFETVFDHVLSSVVSQFFGNFAPSSSMVDNVLDDDSIFFIIPLTSEISKKVTFFYWDPND